MTSFIPAPKLTMDNASATLDAGLRAIAAGQSEIDCAGLLSVDSSAVAILLAWQRQAQLQGMVLQVCALPVNLQSLIDLYGVADVLPLARPAA